MALQEIEFLGGTHFIAVGIDPATGKMYPLPVNPLTGIIPVGAPGSSGGNSDINNILVSVTPGVAAGNLGKAVQGTPGATDTGIAVLWVRADTLSAVTPTNGQYSRGRTDANGALWIINGYLQKGENEADNRMMVETAWTTASITTQTTTVVKSGAGKLGGLLIPTPLANATIKVYDNTAASGTVLVDTITFPAALLSSGPIYLPFLGKTYGTGLTVVTAGATMAVDIDYL